MTHERSRRTTVTATSPAGLADPTPTVVKFKVEGPNWPH